MNGAALARPILLGAVASLALLAFFVAIVTLAEGREAVAPQLQDNAPFFVVLVPAFGTQVGLVVHLRGLMARHHATAMASASGGISGTAMVACCAHFLPSLLPILGISALSSLLTAWKTPLLVVAILANLAGIGYVTLHLRRFQRRVGAVVLERDPVCGMPVEDRWTLETRTEDHRYRFCSEVCRSRFLEEPSRYAS